MDKKLPGYQQTEKIINLYRQAGLSDAEITERLAILENLVLTEIISGIEEKMTAEEKKKFDEFLNTKEMPKPEAIAQFLKLDKQEINRKFESHLDQLLAKLSKNVAA